MFIRLRQPDRFYYIILIRMTQDFKINDNYQQIFDGVTRMPEGISTELQFCIDISRKLNLFCPHMSLFITIFTTLFTLSSVVHSEKVSAIRLGISVL